jgi:hypothetical protein
MHQYHPPPATPRHPRAPSARRTGNRVVDLDAGCEGIDVERLRDARRHPGLRAAVVRGGALERVELEPALRRGGRDGGHDGGVIARAAADLDAAVAEDGEDVEDAGDGIGALLRLLDLDGREGLLDDVDVLLRRRSAVSLRPGAAGTERGGAAGRAKGE